MSKQVPSSQFRVQYHVLTEPVEVTVLGRVIGRYIPSPYGRYWEPAEEIPDPPEPFTVIQGGKPEEEE